MSAILAIARREWRAQFVSPLAWGVLAAVGALGAWLLLSGIESYAAQAARFAGRPDGPGVTDLVVAPLFANLAALLVFVVPLLTMRSIVGERRDGTLPLLFAAGASSIEIALGKFLGALGVPLVLLLLLLVMPLSLEVGTDLDLGKLAAGALGLLLLLAALCALGVLCSAHAQHPASAALGALAAGLIGWIADSAARERGVTDGLVNWLSLPSHLTAFMRGVVASVDVVYFVLLVVLCLGLTAQRLSRLRETG
jgi:ABC-2 type transport system permease protein